MDVTPSSSEKLKFAFFFFNLFVTALLTYTLDSIEMYSL